MSAHCQVDFYVLTSPRRTADLLACKLALMAWERGHSVVVVTPDDNRAKALDELMWEHPRGRFLPHGRGGAGAATGAPVTIVTRPPHSDSDVVINLTGSALEGPLPFRRVLEIVPHDPAERASSREKFRHYRSLGLRPNKHEIN